MQKKGTRNYCSHGCQISRAFESVAAAEVHVSHDLGLAKHHDVVLTARVTKGELHLDKSK